MEKLGKMIRVGAMSDVAGAKSSDNVADATNADHLHPVTAHFLMSSMDAHSPTAEQDNASNKWAKEVHDSPNEAQLLDHAWNVFEFHLFTRKVHLYALHGSCRSLELPLLALPSALDGRATSLGGFLNM